MKRMKKWISVLLSSLMVFALLSGSVCAAENITLPYNYHVRFFAGNQGNLKGNQVLTVEVSNGDTIFFDLNEVTLEKDSKYYVKGIRRSGRDELVSPSIQVTEDADYVIAYGIKGEQVAYKVNYVHENGTQLAEQDVFYGNVGDKPVVAYKYLEGYAPKVSAFTKTLSADEAENVFTFVYVDGETGTVHETVTEEVEYTDIYIDGGAIVVGGGSTVTGGAGAGTGAGTGGGAQDGDENDSQDAQSTGDTAAEGTAEQEIVDLDEGEVPLANVDAEEKTEKVIPMVSYIAIGILALLAIAAGIYLYRKFRKK